MPSWLGGLQIPGLAGSPAPGLRSFLPHGHTEREGKPMSRVGSEGGGFPVVAERPTHRDTAPKI